MGDKIRMSNSSFNQMNSCEMRYAHRKIFGTKVDSDIDTDKPHFKIGSCFHEILDWSWGPDVNVPVVALWAVCS